MKFNRIIEQLEKKTKSNIAVTKEKKDLKIIGITGSRGKSTTAYLIHQYLKKIGYKSALYSSIMIDSSKSKYKNFDAVENPIYDEDMLLDAIKSSINAECDYLILEVNERAISKKIIDDIEFDVRLLTNITPKQNKMYDNYIDLKKSFINANDSSIKIMSVIDDPTRELYRENKKIITVCTEYLKNNKLRSDDKIDYLVMPDGYKYDSINGLTFNLLDSKRNNITKFKTNLFLPFHGLNIACAYAVLNELKVDLKYFKDYVTEISIPGRDEIINYKSNKIIVSLNMVPHLEVLRQYKERNEINNIYLVTGSTGYGFITWDKEFASEEYKKVHKNDIMFAYDYAAKYADKIFITITDIASTNVDEFLAYQESFVKGKVAYEVVKNRSNALLSAICNLKENDVLLVSGRGNREVMCISDRKIIKFQDKKKILEILKGEKNV